MRKRDELFEAIVQHLNLNVAVMTPTERGRVNKSLKELRAVAATPDDVKARVAEYRRLWPKITCTARGLVANWSKLGPTRANAIAFTGTAIRILETMKKEHADGTPRRSDAERFYRERLTADQRRDVQVVQIMSWFRADDEPQTKLRTA